MMDFELLSAIRMIALHDAIEGNYEAFYRKTCRWYSKTFYTPLKEVMEMADEEVLRVYFEETIQTMKSLGDEKFDEYVKEVVQQELNKNKDEEELAAETADDDDWYKEELERLKKEDSKKSKTKKSKSTKKANKNEDIDEKPNLLGTDDSGTFYFNGEDNIE
jgi:hypothetical protein